MDRKDVFDFAAFHKHMMRSVQEEYSRLVAAAEHLTPSLVKIEEILFGTRTMQAEPMASYYAFWEKQLFQATVAMILDNLEDFSHLVSGSKPFFSVRTVLNNVDVTLDPDAPSLVEGLLLIVKAMLEGSKRFIRFYRCKS